MDEARDEGGAIHGMTDLEERLQGPDGAELRSTLMSRLAHLAERLDAKVRAGLPPDEFARATAMKAGVETAQGLLRGSN